MPLEGKAAWDFFHKLQQQETEQISIKLAEAKLKAVQIGKKPFEYDQLSQLVDTSRWSIDRLESMYYLEHPSFMTMQDLADSLEESWRWRD
jgi:hypothetical protein